MNVSSTFPALSYRCAPWTRAQNVDPVGSALTCDTLVLIEVPPPWPKDVSEIPAFADLQRRGLRRTRLLAVRPDLDPGGPVGEVAVPTFPADAAIASDQPGPGAGHGVRVTIWRRVDSSRLVGTDHVVASGNLADSVARLIEAPWADTGRRVAPAEVLLCGHGARDRCCARLGTRLALDVAAVWTGVRVRRCSHTGGHRFAPTGFTLPDGRAWGFLDAEALDAIVRRYGRPPLGGHYRGNTALDSWGQVAERELFERFGWAWLDHALTSARTEIAAGGRSATVELAWHGPTGTGTATARIDVVRDVPVLVCGEPPELATKTATELALGAFSVGGTAAPS
ncbi:sucrase ferredoxin [Pseudofrankia sp. BMG5.37]|uniref:sucrase ferredoxin n=1 Tax=Pseudofrankia sp. BMG5.37 TaxID=3050035 RepID=UPI002895E921|nr:sucrase ferredoxin [Pseudofrankia sp. BMG5.37]MDT3442213.1 sucrase ferredoxin [Pseudofrankia sp. BMG5.37]